MKIKTGDLVFWPGVQHAKVGKRVEHLIRSGIVVAMDGPRALIDCPDGRKFKRHALGLRLTHEEAVEYQREREQTFAERPELNASKCTKRAYPDKRAAMSVVNQVRRKGGGEMRAYPCGMCGNQWHITHYVKEHRDKDERWR